MAVSEYKEEHDVEDGAIIPSISGSVDSTFGTMSHGPLASGDLITPCDTVVHNNEDREVLIKKPHKLPLIQRISFSVGHVLNDLCSAVWFTYLLVYMQNVRNFSPKYAGFALLIGQVVDGVATPFVGLESDRNSDSMNKYGKRKCWHLFGTICVLLSFPLIFTGCIGCEESHDYARLIYYSSFIVIFQIGWASVQISHLSLIPELTPHSNQRTELNAWRYAFTVISNITVYSITWAVFGLNGPTDHTSDDDVDRTGHHHNSSNSHEDIIPEAFKSTLLMLTEAGLSSESSSGDNKRGGITPADGIHFRNIVLSVVAIGTVFSIIFHMVVREPVAPIDRVRNGHDGKKNRRISITSLDNSLPCNHLKWHQWFMVSQFYKVGLLYMGTRLCINLTQAYVPFYLTYSLRLERVS